MFQNKSWAGLKSCPGFALYSPVSSLKIEAFRLINGAVQFGNEFFIRFVGRYVDPVEAGKW